MHTPKADRPCSHCGTVATPVTMLAITDPQGDTTDVVWWCPVCIEKFAPDLAPKEVS